MEVKKILSWNKKASLVYAMGVWTIFGTLFYFKYTGKLDQAQESANIPKKEKNPREVVYETARTKSVIVYRENFVPYETRLMNFIKSFSGGNSSGDNSK